MTKIIIPEEYSLDGNPIELNFRLCIEPIVKDFRPLYRCYYECRLIKNGFLSDIVFSSLGDDYDSSFSLDYIFDRLFQKAKRTAFKYYRNKKIRWSCIDTDF